MEKEIIFYYTKEGKCPYIEWRRKLDLSVRLRVNKRVDKLSEGRYGDCKRLQNSKLSELRMHFGSGYRIYYFDLEKTLILFVAGGDKKEQKKTIELANKYFEDYLERNNKNE